MAYKHKVGDLVLLPPKKEDYKTNSLLYWDPKIQDFFGKVVTISAVTGYSDSRLPLRYYCLIKELPNTAMDPEWFMDVSPELVEQYKKEAEQEAERIRKEKEELYKQYRVKEEEVVAIANSIFGPERVDSRKTGTNGAFELIIHFPEIVIENTAEAFRTLKDIFVRIPVSNIRLEANDGEYKVSIGMSGTRTSLSLEEYESSYFHSHLGSGARELWGGFCLGETSFKLLLRNIMLYPTEDNWEIFLRSIEPYLSWESLEGGPYIKLEQIQMKKIIVSSAELDGEAKKLLPSFPKDVWEFREGDIKLVDDHPLIFEYFNDCSEIRSMKSDVSPKKIKSNITRYKKEWQVARGTDFIFKGQKIPLTIYVEEKQTKEEAGEQTTRARIDANVVQALTARVKSETTNFTKKYAYELAKQSNNTTIRAFGTLQSSNSDSNRKTEESV